MTSGAEAPSRAHPSRGDTTVGYPLELDHVTKRYGHRTVLDDLTFTVQPGRITGFLGPNGSGKSTTMKILLDLASADGGHASIGGTRYRDLRDPARAVGVVLEPNAFHPGRTGRNHLRVVADISGVPHESVDETLALVGLGDAADRRVGTYSLGMKQRLSFAAALLGDPSVLVLDEPGNGLDPQGIRALRDLLRDRADRGHTVFLSSHLLSEVEHLADEVVVVNHGRLVATGSLRDLLTATTHVRTPSPQRLIEAIEGAGGLVQAATDDTVLVRGLTTDEIGEIAFRSQIALRELSRDSSSLEDLFLDWTGGGEPVDLGTATKEVAAA